MYWQLVFGVFLILVVLFAKGGIASVHINGNVITVEFSDTGVDGVEEIISGLYLYWVEGVEVPSDDELTGAVG